MKLKIYNMLLGLFLKKIRDQDDVYEDSSESKLKYMTVLNEREKVVDEGIYGPHWTDLT